MIIDTLKVLSQAKDDGITLKSDCLYGEYATLCDLIGYEAVEKLYLVYGGGYISLSKKFLSDEFVHGYIVSCHLKGRKTRDLAREFDYSYGWVAEIIRVSKKKK